VRDFLDKIKNKENVINIRITPFIFCASSFFQKLWSTIIIIRGLKFLFLLFGPFFFFLLELAERIKRRLERRFNKERIAR
jgi:hypothetical protein